MATITWTGAAGDGNYDNPANWSPHQVPGAGDSAVISTQSPSTVTISQNDAVQALTLNKNVTLAVSTGDSLTVGNAGTANTTLSNAGTLSLNSTYYDSDLIIGSAKVTLSGSGTLLLGNGDDSNRIVAGTAGNQLINVNNTIVGAGQIGAGGNLAFTNQASGVVDANASNQLILNTGTLVASNAGLFEATANGGGLVLQTVVNDGSAGRIAANGGEVLLNGATIEGGTLSSTAGFSVEVVSTSTVDGTANTVTNAGSLVVSTGESLSLLGTLNNTGVLSLQSTYYDSDLMVGPAGSTPGTATLTGGGTVSLGDADGSNRIYGAVAGDTLVNLNNVIAGSGNIGANQLNLVNDGTIDATGANNALFIQTNTFVNNALLEATGTAGLVIEASVNDSGGGTLLSSGGTVQLNGGTVVGGKIESNHGGSIAVVSQGTLDGSSQAVTNLGIVEINTGETLTLLGTIANGGTIGLNSSYYDSDLIVGSATVTLNGGGTLALSDYSANRIYGAAATDVLDNVNNLIEGGGQIGAGQLTLINEAAGVIDATGASNQLVLSTGTTVINRGLIEATGAAGMALSSTVANTGTILAAGGDIYLNGADIEGGLLASSGTGQFIGNGQTTLDGSAHAIVSTAAIEVSTGDTATLYGMITNEGTIGLNSSYYDSDLIVGSATVTLNGGGTLALSDYGANRIYGAVAADVLDNVNNTIEGSGQIGAGQLTLINEKAGVIDSTGTQGLTISTGTTLVNHGLIESTGTGGLALASTVSNDGTILAAGSDIYLNGADIQGGLLRSTGGGQFIGNGQTTLDGSVHAIVNNADFEISTGQTATVLGTITNEGTIGLNSSYYDSDLIVASPTLTLNGGGIVVLSDYSANRIYGQAATNVLDNVNNTIEGSGQLGAGQLTLVNAGTISATGTNALVVNLGSTGTNTASGQMLGEGSGGLVFQNGTYTNQGLIAAESGSSVTLQSGAVLTNDSAAGVLTGGTYGAVSAGGTATATASFTGAAVVTDDAAILLSGAGSEISFGGTAIEASLKTIGKGASLSVLGGRGYTTKNVITNSGTLALAGGVFKAGALNDKSTALLTGHGTLSAKFTDAGSIVANGGELDLLGKTSSVAGTISGSGTLGFGGTTTLNAGTVLDVSSIALLNKATLNIAAPVSFAGTFDVTGTASLTGTATFTNAGLFEATGKGAGAIGDPFANSGTISVAAGSSLAFSGGLANTGLILDSGTFTDTAALTGGSLTLGGSSTSAVIASAAGAGNSTLATLTTAGGALNTSGTTLTVTGDYNNTAAGTGNSYHPFAGVTGTIDGKGTQLSVVGVNGTTISTVNGTLTVAVQAGHTAQFEIENTGPSGSAALRGALQTTVNGGSITGTALSGSGVTASDFGPIAAGGASGVYKIAYSGGTLSGEAIHIASDFANVAGLTIDIVAAPANMEAAGPAASTLRPEVVHDAFLWLPTMHQA